jgi:hypothetical protein
MPLELIVGAAVGAAAASPKIRGAVRRGMIYGLGGLLVAYDKVSAMAHEAAQGARKGFATAAASGQATPAQASPAAASPPSPAPAAPPAQEPSPAASSAPTP